MANAARAAMLASTVLAFFIFVLFGFKSFYPINGRPSFSLSRPDSHAFRAPRKNVWADLTASEAKELTHWLLHATHGLNLSGSQDAHASSSQIFLVEAMAPNKSDALPYTQGIASAPPRMARVVITRSGVESAYFEEFMVELPPGQSSGPVPLSYPYTTGRNTIPRPMLEFEDLTTWFRSEAIKFADILKDLMGDSLEFGESGVCENARMNGRFLRTEGDRTLMWTSLGTGEDAWSLMPQGLYLELDVTSRRTSQWKILRWYYAGKLYSSTTAFREAWERGLIRKTLPNTDDGWTDTEDFSANPERERPPPLAIQPHGSRFEFDSKERYVSWMGFTFYISTRAATMVSLHDIRFRGQPVMFELGLQEAIAHYSGNNPMQSGQLWLDTFYGMGLRMFELVPGYDCPAYATYLETEFYPEQKTWSNPNSICIFEYTADYAMQRHTTDNYVGVTRNTYLVVRSVSTVGNYDYTIDYIFFLDGTIEVKVRASGYIFSAFFEALSDSGLEKRDGEGNEYGYRVHDAVSGCMHDHVINFKADLDVVGSENSLIRVDENPVVKEYPWEHALEKPRNTMHLVTSPISKETGIDWPPNARSIYVVVSNETNIWGEKKGYKIAPGTGLGTPPHLTIQNSTTMQRASMWSDHDLWVLKQHDTEPKSAYEFNVLMQGDPPVDFAKFVDGESVSEEDLVIFFNLGTHHVPTTNDIPNTLAHTASSSVMFIPHNFNDRDPSRVTAQGVKLELDPHGKSEHGRRIRYYGQEYQSDESVGKKSLEPDLTKYKGTPHGIMSENGEVDERRVDLSSHGTFIGMGIFP